MFAPWLKRQQQDVTSRNFWKAAAAEFIGTFTLTMFGVATSLYDVTRPDTAPNSVHIALETGLFVGIIIATLSHVSGAHVNPAVSIGFLVGNQITCIRFAVYVMFQTSGAICGAGLLWLTTPKNLQGGAFGVISPAPGVTSGHALMCEATQGFLLLLGVAGLLDRGRTDVHGSVPLVIGFIVVVNVFFGWNISGGCMNPARNFGPAVITGKYNGIWVYWLGPMLGGAVGALLYQLCFSTETYREWWTISSGDQTSNSDTDEKYWRVPCLASRRRHPPKHTEELSDLNGCKDVA